MKATAMMTINHVAGSVTFCRSATFFATIGRMGVRFCLTGVGAGVGRTRIGGSAAAVTRVYPVPVSWVVALPTTFPDPSPVSRPLKG
jgi:hypothetical protein